VCGSQLAVCLVSLFVSVSVCAVQNATKHIAKNLSLSLSERAARSTATSWRVWRRVPLLGRRGDPRARLRRALRRPLRSHADHHRPRCAWRPTSASDSTSPALARRRASHSIGNRYGVYSEIGDAPCRRAPCYFFSVCGSHVHSFFRYPQKRDGSVGRTSQERAARRGAGAESSVFRLRSAASVKISEDPTIGLSPNLAQLIQHGS